MNTAKMKHWCVMVGVLAIAIGVPSVGKSDETNMSGIVSYIFNPNPQRFAGMYNWEVKLNASDSTNGVYQIVEVTQPVNSTTNAGDVITRVLIGRSHLDRSAIGINEDGFVDFKLHLGDKEPTQNMDGPGQIGESFACSGNGAGESEWVVLPGSKLDRAVPSERGTRMLNGRLQIIRFIVTSDHGQKFQSDVVLQRK